MDDITIARNGQLIMKSARKRSSQVAATAKSNQDAIRDLCRERQALRESLAAMERMMGVVAHDLRTPLASVRALAELLITDGCHPPQANEFAARIHEEAVRMSRIVDDLLEAARLNSGRARWNWSAFALEPLCQLALEAIRPLVAPTVQLTCAIEPPNARMSGDADALRRLMINLLSNAQKHTSAGHIHLAVRCYSDDSARWVALRVSDTGTGIDPDVLPRLGQPFALNSGPVGSDPASGTGLGLAICRGIAEAHGGGLRFSSTPGQGTTVTAVLRADLAGPAVPRQGAPASYAQFAPAAA